MRILMWSEALLPVRGGQELAVVNLAAGLMARGHQVAAVTSGPEGVSDLDGMTVHSLPLRAAIEGGDPRATLRMVAETARVKKSFRPDLVHVHFLGPSPFFHLQTQGMWPCPFLVTVHGELHHCEAGEGTVMRRLFDGAGEIAAVSKAMVDEVLIRAPHVGDKTRLIYNGQPALVAGGRRMSERPYLFCSGRHAPEKGLDVAIEAFARLRGRHPELRLVIAGEGLLRPDLEAQAKALGLGEDVTFTGWVPDEDLRDWIAGAAAVLVPSRWREGFGLVASEAAMLGRPVIASRSGGLEEVVVEGETGLLVPSENPDALAEAAHRLLSDPALADRMGREAARDASARFGFDPYVNQYEQLYEGVAGGLMARSCADVGA